MILLFELCLKRFNELNQSERWNVNGLTDIIWLLNLKPKLFSNEIEFGLKSITASTRTKNGIYLLEFRFGSVSTMRLKMKSEFGCIVSNNGFVLLINVSNIRPIIWTNEKVAFKWISILVIYY